MVQEWDRWDLILGLQLLLGALALAAVELAVARLARDRDTTGTKLDIIRVQAGRKRQPVLYVAAQDAVEYAMEKVDYRLT